MDASRFDAVARGLASGLPRRRLLRLAAGLGVGGFLLARTRPAAAVVVDCSPPKCPSDRPCPRCDVVFLRSGRAVCGCYCVACSDSGIVGGGAVAVEGGGETHLALLATRTALPEPPDAFAVTGHVLWADPAWEGAGLTLQSSAVASYRPLPDIEGGREVLGWMQTDQRPGEYPFVLRAVATGAPGSGQDSVALWVGDAVLEDPTLDITFEPAPEPSGFGYRAEGQLVSGALQLVSLGSPSEAAVTATPTS